MKISRKLKFSLIFLVCWFALMTLLVDGILKFNNVLNFFGGSYLLTETILLSVVFVPAILVYLFTKKTK